MSEESFCCKLKRREHPPFLFFVSVKTISVLILILVAVSVLVLILILVTIPVARLVRVGHRGLGLAGRCFLGARLILTGRLILCA